MRRVLRAIWWFFCGWETINVPKTEASLRPKYEVPKTPHSARDGAS